MTHLAPATVIARLGYMKGERTNFDTWWQATADQVDPLRDFTRQSTEGGSRGLETIFNTTAINAALKLAVILQGTMVPQQMRWLELHCVPEDLDRRPAVRRFYEAVTNEVLAHFQDPQTGFSVAIGEALHEAVHYGNPCIFTRDAESIAGPAYSALPLAENFIGVDEEGAPNRLWRYYPLRLEQIVDRQSWLARLPENIIKAATKTPGEKRFIIHATYPDPAKRGQYLTQWVLEDGAVGLEESVYDEFPFAPARFFKRPAEIYGIGLSMFALPDARSASKMEETAMRHAARAAAPPILLPDDGFLNPFTTAPNRFNYFRAGSPGIDLVKTLPPGDAMPLDRRIEAAEKRMERLYLLDLLQLPNQPNMTATEVWKRWEQLFRTLGPLASRLALELLGPVIHRTIAVLGRRGRLPQRPPELEGAHNYRTMYTSPLFQAQRAQDADAVLRFFAAVGQIAQFDQTIPGYVDGEYALRFIQDRMGAPIGVVKSAETIKAETARRQEEQAQANNQQAAIAAATAAQRGADAFSTFREAGAAAGEQGNVMPFPVAA